MGDVLVNLHGEDHRARRRLENRLFRRPALLHYERELFPGIMEATLRPHVEAGEADLVDLGHQLMMNLSALTAGVDRPQGTPEETARLYAYLRTFIEGATLGHYTGDRDAKRAEVAAALLEFDDEFLAPAIDRRTALHLSLSSGIAEEVFFRGVMQPAVGYVTTSVLFGIVHVGPSRRYLAWTAFAVAMGFILGWSLEATGSLLGPILAHVAVNFVNLLYIGRLPISPDYRPAGPAGPGQHTGSTT